MKFWVALNLRPEVGSPVTKNGRVIGRVVTVRQASEEIRLRAACDCMWEVELEVDNKEDVPQPLQGTSVSVGAKT